MDSSDVTSVFIQLLEGAISNRASDIHITSGEPPSMRVSGDLRKVEGVTLSAEDVSTMLRGIMKDSQYADFSEGKDVDFSFERDNVRFRINAHHTVDGPAFVARVLNPKIPQLASLNLPPKINELIHSEKGLILVTGATGSGKSTSLAAMIHELNKTKPLKIITIEDPVEYKHKSDQSSIIHREVGSSAASFASSLKSALRQDPDVILIGELRDQETALEALRAAETGHLVFSTVHTGSAAQAADRIVGMFPEKDKEFVRNSLATNLIGVMTQQLVDRADGKGRVAAAELLVNTNPVKNHIRTSKTPSIISAMQTGMRDGMVTMDKSLKNLKEDGVISFDTHETALANYNRESGMGTEISR